MKIDDQRKLVLTKRTKVRGQVRVTESDHNPIYLEVNIPWEVKVKKTRLEVFNLRNVECQARYFEYTNNSDFLTHSLVSKDIRVGGKLWLKNMKFIITENFRKIRLNWKNQNDVKIQELFNKRNELIKNSQSLSESDQLLADQIYDKNRLLIIDQVTIMNDSAGNFSQIRMWKVKQKICPKFEVNTPVAKIDSSGNLISNQDELKNLYVNTYKERLKHREMVPTFAHLKNLKNNLFYERLELSKWRKSERWSEDDLMRVLKSLKTKKSTDPVGLINELFKPQIAGSDVINSLLIFSNKVKDQCEIPSFFQLTNISSIYKNRGSKNDLTNDRGLFTVSAVRSIIDKLIYYDIYDVVDHNMSDSNVGGRKGRNIRDNLFILNGIINYAIKENIDIDINLYDIEKCFDAMWYQETMNDMWDVGVQDDKFKLMAKIGFTAPV